MPTAAQYQAELVTLHNESVAATIKLQQDLASIGEPPISQEKLDGMLQEQVGGLTIAQTLELMQEQANTYGLIPAGAPASATALIQHDLGVIFGLAQQARAVYEALHPEGFDWLGILPLFFVAGLGAAVAVGATTAAAASATASTAVGGGPGLVSLGGTTTAELGTTASSLATISSSLGGTTTTSVANAAASAVTALTGSTSLGNVVDSVVNGIGGLVTDIENIISPLVHAGESILSGIEDLNKNIITPLANTISQDYTTITGLINEVHLLATSGIQGILAIPQTISNAFTSLDAANMRLAQATGNINKGIAEETLVPGIGGAIASPLGDIHKAIDSAFNKPVPQAGELRLDTLNEAAFAGYDPTASQQKILEAWSQGGIFARFAAEVVSVFKDLLQFAGFLETYASFAAQAGRLAQPITPINPAEAVKAWWRGQLSPEQAAFEIKRHGLDATRAQLLHDMEQWLPTAPDAIRMFYQGIYSSEQVASQLEKQGMSAADVEALLQAAPERVDPREAIALDGRFAAAAKGFISGSLGSPPPDAYKLLYPPFMKDANRAPLDWLGHWNIEDIHWWITAYFRQLVTREQVELAGMAHNIPPEVLPNLIEVDSEVIQLWMIPDMLATGILSEAEAMTYMSYIGMDPKSAAIIVKYGLAKTKVLPAVDVQQYSKLALGASADMYKTGIINRSVYIDILLAHGYSVAAATLEADYQDQAISLAARKAFAAGLIKQVLAGGIDQAQMDQALRNENFTTAEVNSYNTELQGKLDAKAKIPSTAEIKSMIGAGILTETQGLQLLELDGYSPFIAQAFMTLWFGGSNAAPNTGSTGTPTA